MCSMASARAHANRDTHAHLIPCSLDQSGNRIESRCGGRVERWKDEAVELHVLREQGKAGPPHRRSTDAGRQLRMHGYMYAVTQLDRVESMGYHVRRQQTGGKIGKGNVVSRISCRLTEPSYASPYISSSQLAKHPRLMTHRSPAQRTHHPPPRGGPVKPPSQVRPQPPMDALSQNRLTGKQARHARSSPYWSLPPSPPPAPSIFTSCSPSSFSAASSSSAAATALVVLAAFLPFFTGDLRGFFPGLASSPSSSPSSVFFARFLGVA